MGTQRDQYNKCADVFSGVLGGEHGADDIRRDLLHV